MLKPVLLFVVRNTFFKALFVQFKLSSSFLIALEAIKQISSFNLISRLRMTPSCLTV